VSKSAKVVLAAAIKAGKTKEDFLIARASAASGKQPKKTRKMKKAKK
jgi:hypothetical protein